LSVGEIEIDETVQLDIMPMNSTTLIRTTVNQKNPLGPFADRGEEQDRKVLDEIAYATFTYTFTNTKYSRHWSRKPVNTKFRWKATATYDFQVDIEARYYIEFRSQPMSMEILTPGLMVIDLANVLCSLASTVLIVRALRKSFKAFEYVLSLSSCVGSRFAAFDGDGDCVGRSNACRLIVSSHAPTIMPLLVVTNLNLVARYLIHI
jgi:hypothetical protein